MTSLFSHVRTIDGGLTLATSRVSLTTLLCDSRVSWEFPQNHEVWSITRSVEKSTSFFKKESHVRFLFWSDISSSVWRVPVEFLTCAAVDGILVKKYSLWIFRSVPKNIKGLMSGAAVVPLNDINPKVIINYVSVCVWHRIIVPVLDLNSCRQWSASSVVTLVECYGVSWPLTFHEYFIESRNQGGQFITIFSRLKFTMFFFNIWSHYTLLNTMGIPFSVARSNLRDGCLATQVKLVRSEVRRPLGEGPLGSVKPWMDLCGWVILKICVHFAPK